MSTNKEKLSPMDRMTAVVGKMAGPMSAFGNLPFIRAVTNGMIASLPVTMIGSLFLVVYLLGSDGGLTTHALLPFLKPISAKLALVNSLSMGIMAIYIAVAMGSEYASIKGFSHTTGAVGSLFAFILLNYNEIGALAETAKDGTVSAGASAVGITYWGSAGVITAMVAAAISVNIISVCYKKNIVIKLPDSVPPAIGNSFSAIIPYFFITLVCWGVRTLAGFNLPEWVGTILMPILGKADNVWVYTLQQFLSSLLWICGLHGDNITGAATSVFLNAWTIENQTQYAAGVAIKDLPYVWTSNLCRLGQWVSTCWPLLIFMYKDSKKLPQLKPLAVVATPPMIFCIVEPIMFGLPVILNPFFVIPFLVSHTLAAILTYEATALGFVGKLAVNLPWATPSPILGFLGGGGSIGGLLWPFIMCAMGCVIFYPFWNAYVKDEQKKMAENAKAEAEAAVAEN